MPTKKKTSPTKKPAAKKAAKKPAAKKAAKKPAAKKTAAKKTAAKKTAAKKTAAKKPAAKKTAAKKVAKKATKKTAAKKTAAKKTAAKKVAKTATKKTAAKKTAAKKTATKKTAAKKPAAKKAAAQKTAKKPAAKKASATSSLATALIAAPEALNAYGALSSKKTAALTTDKVKKPAKADVDVGHGDLQLPAKKKPLDVGGYAPAPSSKRAAVTVVPAGDDVDDALDDAMDGAFAAVFQTPPSSKKPSAPFVAGEASLDLAQTCAALALEKKADDVVILQVAELTSYADYFVIAAASSERQAQAVARNIADELRRRGKQPLSTDGLEQGNWVIVDYGAVVVHVFMESARAYYDLDGFWVDAPRIAVDEAQGKGALESMG